MLCGREGTKKKGGGVELLRKMKKRRGKKVSHRFSHLSSSTFPFLALCLLSLPVISRAFYRSLLYPSLWTGAGQSEEPSCTRFGKRIWLSLACGVCLCVCVCVCERERERERERESMSLRSAMWRRDDMEREERDGMDSVVGVITCALLWPRGVVKK